MDLVVPRDKVLPKVDEYNRDNIFTETFFISALKETGLDDLKVSHRDGDWFFSFLPGKAETSVRLLTAFLHSIIQKYLISKAAPGEMLYPTGWVPAPASTSCVLCALCM
jgi:hypothetical protein